MDKLEMRNNLPFYLRCCIALCGYIIRLNRSLLYMRNLPHPTHSISRRFKLRSKAGLKSGFALIATISVMVLLVMIALAMLSLSTIELRASKNGEAMAEAQANARVAMMIALGELQKEMGPDMRVSAESALFDQNKETETIEGVAQSHWLASYNSWGNWLNDSYSPPDGSGSLKISDTYTPGREKMFRRWLLSMPQGKGNDIDAPKSLTGWNDTNSVVLVGKGSLGIDPDQPKPGDELDKVTRAYLIPVGKTGKQAWWIGAENQKARIDMANNPRALGVDAWQVTQGNTAEVGVGSLPGFEALDTDASLGARLITNQSLLPAQVAEDIVQKHFFDLSASGRGVIASVRTGQLKKDLSLLFEKPNSSLPTQYKFNPADIREPSIRPMSPELADKRPAIPARQFASWTNMRHFYRMYRSSSDATATEQGVDGVLSWKGSKPSADYASSSSCKISNPRWNGSNNYWRTPILAKLTLIYSLVTKPAGGGKYNCLQYYSPVFTYWNPYNTELVIPSGKMSISSKGYRMWPTNSKFYLNGAYKAKNGYGEARNFLALLTSGGSGDIVFQPGELKVFSMKETIDSTSAGGRITTELVPGFDPNVVIGDERKWRVGSATAFSPAEKPGAAYEFSCAQWGGGVNMGNTPGAVFIESRFAGGSGELPLTYSNDWFQRAPHTNDQTNTAITPPGTSNLHSWDFDGNPKIVAYAQMSIKGLFKHDYPSIRWDKDWRSRNWIQAPPFYFGSGMYMSLDNTIAHTQRLDCPYTVNFGPTTTFGVSKIIGQSFNDPKKAFLGRGEQVTSAAMLELPSAPISSLAGFSNMRINPGWLRADQLSPNFIRGFTGNGSSVAKCSLYAAESKRVAYQSGVTGPGLGNSFMHPMLPRDDVYRFIDNSKSRDVIDRTNPNITEEVNTKAYCDYWDHVFLLNDALWDDYFVSSLADQTRPGASAANSLSENLDLLVDKKELANSRYIRNATGQTSATVKTELAGANGYLKAAKHLMVDGMFNVNSTSVDAWYALFAGISERKAVYRDGNGNLNEINVPSGKRIVLTRFNTEVSDKEMENPTSGVTMPDGSKGWSGVRFLDDEELMNLARECVKQVKLRGPFLNFSEFVNRRLSNDELGIMGALQSAIDYDDASPESGSINYRYKQSSALRITKSDLGVAASDPDVSKRFSTPEAAEGSRLAGIPGYVIQSDLLKPIANTLSVRDDTFRIRAYGEALDAKGNVIARAWCEAIVQRLPEYCDRANPDETPLREIGNDGAFKDSGRLSAENLRFGRQFKIESFRWLNENEV